MKLSKEIECPWCGKKVIPEAKVSQRKIVDVVERSCPLCGKLIAAYHGDEAFLDTIRQRVLTFKD